jgi:DnaK suppressor protein
MAERQNGEAAMAKEKKSKAKVGASKAASRVVPAKPAAARSAPAKAAAKSSVKPAVKSSAKPAAKPAAKPVPKAATKVVAKPIAKPIARPAPAAGKPSPTPGKPSHTMTSRKPESSKASSGASVPSASASRRALFARPAPREKEPELPHLKKSPYGKKELQPMRAALLELRSRLQGAIDKLGNEALRADESETDAEDVADHGSDAFERNMTLGLLENEARTLQQIEEALEQMETGRYGVCTVCGQAVPLARLEALPFATTCVPCKEKQERRG